MNISCVDRSVFDSLSFKEYKSKIHNLPDCRINVCGYTLLEYSVYEKEPLNERMRNIYAYVKQAVHLKQLDLNEIKEIRKMTKIWRVFNYLLPLEMKHFYKIEKKLKEFLATIPENIKSPEMYTYEERSTFFIQENSLRGKDIYKAAAYLDKTMSFSGEDASDFYQKYKKVNLPASVLYCIKTHPGNFEICIFPELSDEEIQTLVYFRNSNDITKEKLVELDNDFVILHLLIKNKYYELVEKMTDRIKISEELANWLKNWQIVWNDYKTALDGLQDIDFVLEEKNTNIGLHTYFKKEGSNSFVARALLKNDKDVNLRRDGKKYLSLLLETLFRIPDRTYLSSQQRNFINRQNFTAIKLKDYRNGEYNTYKFVEPFFENKTKLQVIRNDVEITDCYLRPSSFNFEHEHGFFSINWLSWFINGNKLEVFDTDLRSKLNDLFWNNWEIRSVNAELKYENCIRPLLKQVIDNIIAFKQWDNPVIIDVCAGKGDLAYSIVKDYSSIDYTLLERNQHSINIARSKLGTKAQVVETDIVKDKEFFRDVEKTKAFEIESVDIVVGSGALTRQVLDNDEGKIALLNISKYLKKNGYLLLSGRTSSLLSSQDFIECGYEILNMTLPSIEQENNLTQFYVLKKIRSIV